MNLLIRADASVEIGTGHVMRCLALAQAWQDVGGQAEFAMAESTAAIQARLAAESCGMVALPSEPGTTADAGETIALARQHQAEWVAVDGYRFSAEYQQELKQAGCKVLFLDDYGHAEHYFADVVLNQNVQASEEMYGRKERSARLLLGPRYCLLRREFSGWREWKREIAPAARKLLVTMGGSDSANVTGRVIEALQMVEVEGLEATVVVGGSNPHLAELQKSACESSRKIAVMRDVANLPELMAGCDAAVSAAGSTCWELCLLGLPSLLIDVAENQAGVAKAMDASGCAVHVGNGSVETGKIAQELERLLQSQSLRQSLAERSRKLVDGHGAERVVSVLRGRERLHLRRARERDGRLLWEWANDPAVRAASFSSEPISWETHRAWLARIVADGDCILFVAEDEGASPLGQIRFDSRADGDWEIDVSVARNRRGQRLASRLIACGVKTVLKNAGGRSRFHAFVKPANVASLRAFEKADFRRIATEQVHGSPAVHLIYEGSSA